MEVFLPTVIALIGFSTIAYCAGVNKGIDEVIKNKFVCVESKKHGVEFKKCYELKEMGDR